MACQRMGLKRLAGKLPGPSAHDRIFPRLLARDAEVLLAPAARAAVARDLLILLLSQSRLCLFSSDWCDPSQLLGWS